MKPKLPIGIQTFRRLREDGCYYVDKAPYAKRLADEGTHYFLSRPQRFGKSLFPDTLKELFEGNEALFRGLHVHDKWGWSVRHPVLRLSFGGGEFKQPDYLQEDVTDQLEAVEDCMGVQSRHTSAPPVPGGGGRGVPGDVRDRRVAQDRDYHNDEPPLPDPRAVSVRGGPRDRQGVPLHRGPRVPAPDRRARHRHGAGGLLPGSVGSELRERIVQHLEAIDFPPGASSGSEEADFETADSSAAVHPAREARHAGGRCGASGTRRWFRPITSCPCRIRTGSSLVRSARPASQPRVEIRLALAL